MGFLFDGVRRCLDPAICALVSLDDYPNLKLAWLHVLTISVMHEGAGFDVVIELSLNLNLQEWYDESALLILLLNLASTSTHATSCHMTVP